MSRFVQHVLLFALALATFEIAPVSAAVNHFQHWYPEWGFIFDNIILKNCSTQYELFLHGSKNRTQWYETSRWIGSGSKAALVVPLVNCILDHSSEYIKSGMAAATVILGLTPTILASLGSSVDETSVLSVVGRRPFLALCLSAGSPAVAPMRLFQYHTLTEVLKHRPGRLKLLFFPFWGEVIILIMEYLIVFAAIANVALLGYDLGTKAVLVFAPHLTFLVLLWVFLGVVPHLLTGLALRLRIRINDGESQNSVYSLKKWISPWKQTHTATFKLYPETLFSTSISGFVSLYITAHIIFGTLVFSSTLFISVRDTIPLIGRFLASVIVCRVVLMYELARLRHLIHEKKRYELVEQTDEEAETHENQGKNTGYLRLFRSRTNSGFD